MKKLLFFIAFATAIMFISCTELDENEELIQQEQAIDKGDSSNPNNNGGEDPDNGEE
tara:strand:- start:581 stop:751 length:171 start_codon:yes stop_codon:yes gene_type:complete